MTDTATIKNDDYARFHIDYHEDPDLCLIADHLTDAHGEKGSYIVWLYWPRLITAAKAAKSFGWFAMTPRRLATTIGDVMGVGDWAIRAEMWQMLVDAGLVQIRQGRIESLSMKVDVLLTEWEKWQVWTTAERKKLERERRRVAVGEACHWTVAHLAEFRDEVTPRTPDPCDAVTEIRDTPPATCDSVTENRGAVTTHDTTQHNKEGMRAPAAPTTLPSIIELACQQVAEATGISDVWWVSSVQKLRHRNLSAPDTVFVDALDWVMTELDGQRIDSKRGWAMLRGAVDKGVKRHKDQPTIGTPAAADFTEMYAKLGNPGAAA